MQTWKACINISTELLYAIRPKTFVWLYSLIYTGDPRTCTILIPACASNWGFSDFSGNQNNCGSSGVYVTCIFCNLSLKINMRKMPVACTDRGRICTKKNELCLFFHTCGRQKAEDPQFEPHGPWLMPLHEVGCLGSPMYNVYLWQGWSVGQIFFLFFVLHNYYSVVLKPKRLKWSRTQEGYFWMV